MEKLTLYSYYRSTAAYPVRIALNYKNIPYDVVPVHLIKDGGENWKQEYLDINPQGLVPALAVGDRVIFQSMAILEYLEEAYPDKPLLPEDPVDRAFVRGLAQIIACDIHPINNLRILDYLKKEMKANKEQVDKWYCNWISEGLSAIEMHLRKSAKYGAYCFGDTPTLADAYLVPQLFNAHRFNCNILPYPLINEIEQNCMEIQAFIDAAPENQADADDS